MNYHLARNGQQLGTCTRDEAIARYARGEILPTDLVWCEGMPNWAAASTVFGATSAPAAAATPPAAVQPLTPPPTATPVSPFAAAGTGGASPMPPPKKPENFLVWSILATVLCCLPAGIAAIIYSTQVDSKYAAGDYAGAEASAKNAKMWSMISAGVTVVGLLIYVIVMVVIGISGAAASGGF